MKSSSDYAMNNLKLQKLTAGIIEFSEKKIENMKMLIGLMGVMK